MRLLTWFLNLFSGNSDDPEVLDHVGTSRKLKAKAKADALKAAREARERALRRHGRQFQTDNIKPRETPPSPELQRIMSIKPREKEPEAIPIKRAAK